MNIKTNKDNHKKYIQTKYTLLLFVYIDETYFFNSIGLECKCCVYFGDLKTHKTSEKRKKKYIYIQ